MEQKPMISEQIAINLLVKSNEFNSL